MDIILMVLGVLVLPLCSVCSLRAVVVPLSSQSGTRAPCLRQTRWPTPCTVVLRKFSNNRSHHRCRRSLLWPTPVHRSRQRAFLRMDHGSVGLLASNTWTKISELLKRRPPRRG